MPEEIYQIPPESPKHNTTYVYITDSDSETVTTARSDGWLYGYDDRVQCSDVGHRLVLPTVLLLRPNVSVSGLSVTRTTRMGRGVVHNPATGFYGRGAVAYGPYGGMAEQRRTILRPALTRRGAAYGPYRRHGDVVL